MKSIKRVMAIIVSVSMVVSGIVFTANTKAATSVEEWKDNAVVTPTEGSLIGAGYIDVEFDNSMPGYQYEVLIDGKSTYWTSDEKNIIKEDIGEVVDSSIHKIKKFSSTDTPKTEVYTTSVAKHVITVKATNGSETIMSNPRTVYVSKKGLAMGDDMGDKVQLKKLNCSWYYNWGVDAFSNSIDENVNHVPMMWGAGEGSIQDMNNIGNSKSNYLLGFNEPDIGHQANMNAILGIRAWKQYISPVNLRKVSPAPAEPNGAAAWVGYFLNGVDGTYNDDGDIIYLKDYPNTPYPTFFEAGVEDCDAVALHYYKGKTDIDELVRSIEKTWNAFKKPIWVTEVSVMGKKNSSYDFSYEIPERREQVKQFVTNIANRLDNIDYVERYCWFPYDITKVNELDHMDGSGATAMFSYDTGAYTELGVAYSNLGNPAGYIGNSISKDEMYQDPSETTTQEPTTEQTTTVKPTNKQPATVKPTTQNNKPGAVSLKTAKNVKKKSVKLSWKKNTKAKSYQLQYSLNKAFKKKVVTKTTNKTSFKVKKLKKKKKYFFRVRAKNEFGFGKWSNTKVVKIKK